LAFDNSEIYMPQLRTSKFLRIEGKSFTKDMDSIEILESLKFGEGNYSG